MGWFENLKTNSKLFVGFGVMCVLLMGVSGMAYRTLAGVNGNERNEVDASHQAEVTLLEARSDQNRIRGSMMMYAMTADATLRTSLLKEIEQRRSEITTGLDSLKMFLTKQELGKDLALLADVERNLGVYDEGRAEALRLYAAGRTDEARALLTGAQVERFERTRVSMIALGDSLHLHTAAAVAESERLFAVAVRVLVVVAVATLLFALFMIWLMNRLIAAPLSKTVRMTQEMTKGRLDTRLKIKRNDEVGLLAGAMDQLADTVQEMVGEANKLAKAAVEGRLSTRGDADKFEGSYRDIVRGVNDTLNAVIGPLNVAAGYIDRIAKGDIPAKITDSYNGDFNLIKNNLNTCIDAVNGLVADAGVLSKAAVEGKLATRADANKHQGDFRRVVQGVNDTLDAVIGPLNVAAGYVDRIAKGDIPAKITDSYNGDFNLFKNNLNSCIDAVNALVADAGVLSKAGVEGKLATRADANKHQGDFRKIVQGVNDTLDAVIGPLRVAAGYVDRIAKGDIPAKITDSYNGDFSLIKDNLNTCIDAVNALVADAGVLSKAAVAGKLATRADANKHQGDFRRIVQGVNDTLDAVIGPLNVAASIVDRVAKDDIPRPIADKYNGDFDVLKNNLNKMVDNLRGLNKELQSGFSVLASSSTQILATVSQVAAGASETATAVSETSTTAEEVKQTAHLSNQKAKAVQESAQRAAVVSEVGRKAVAETLEGMNRIREQMESIAESVVRLSEQGQTIGEIIATVNDLAEQSNLLAVNAAIEATRAGEYGRGFAVVAQEVKSLAEQSRQATTLVRTILMEVQKATSAAVMATEQGTKAVAAGVKQATDAGDSIRALTSSVGEAAQAATQIAASSQQQLVGMDQIASAIANIRQATTQNVAGSRQLEASAQSLQELGGRLKDLVERQRVEV